MSETLTTGCCVVGGGPAGMMLGLLLARAGVEVLVLEKHSDFLRDFRGDTIHPSTLEIMSELGLLEDLLKRPHVKAPRVEARALGMPVGLDFRGVPAKCRFVAFMPQWHFLAFLAERAFDFPNFRLFMSARADDLVLDGGRVAGLRAETPAGMLEVRAGLVVAADGRSSLIRAKAGLEVEELGAPMDVLWFRLPRVPGDPDLPFARFEPGAVFVGLNQGAHWQCGLVVPKGAFGRVKAQGLPAFKERVASRAPMLAGRLEALGDWGDVKLLTVKVDRLRRWYREGLLCIGDAAHAMSPIGGVGINLAIQDAVATANLLGPVLRAGRPSREDLARVQRRRLLPTRVTQRMQVLLQNSVIAPLLAPRPPRRRPPLSLRLLSGLPPLQRAAGRLVGMGLRPEHVARLG